MPGKFFNYNDKYNFVDLENLLWNFRFLEL